MIKKNCSICGKPTECQIIYNQYLPKNNEEIIKTYKFFIEDIAT